ncbi:hypothetical protein SESBI_30926 [Sesbania bispinosa]|nr:hypothetical protein SESBI_30926 [Sesbania bispinosa]
MKKGQRKLSGLHVIIINPKNTNKGEVAQLRQPREARSGARRGYKRRTAVHASETAHGGGTTQGGAVRDWSREAVEVAAVGVERNGGSRSTYNGSRATE